ncbi:MAG: hemerythrin domain-containing protein [Candidatus Falkowbacteria bacterium]|nr:hemerythrin domain-containing protein [Candidatus Falkowbacteria bacterium]
MSDQELILLLKSQHLNLRKDLSDVLEGINSDNKDENDLTVLNLNRFKNDLLDHLKLEDEKFYPAYFQKSQYNKEVAQKLMLQMNQIAEVVINFFKKYENLAEIIDNKNYFISELLEIVNTLNIRIETEEEGIYELFLV